MRRIRADLIFDNTSTADLIWKALKSNFKTYVYKVAGEGRDVAKSIIEYEDCGHDQSPNVPCVIIESLKDG